MFDSTLERAQKIGQLKKKGSENFTLAPCSFFTINEAGICIQWTDCLRQKICIRHCKTFVLDNIDQYL